MSGQDDSPLSRWSRRKRAAAEREAAAAISSPEPEAAPPAEPELSEADWLAANDLPDPETLGEGADFTAYLKDGVPHLLRRRALRQLWRANPLLANLDGLVEYGEDYTDAAMVPEVLATVYKVGKGMLKEALEGDDDGGGAEDAAEDEGPEAEAPPETPVEPETLTGADAIDRTPASRDIAPDDISDEPAFRPRRMAFNPE